MKPKYLTINPDGAVFSHTSKPKPLDTCWGLGHGAFLWFEEPPEDWKLELYEISKAMPKKPKKLAPVDVKFLMDVAKGLMWSCYCIGEETKYVANYSYDEALAEVKRINEERSYAGYSDWRLPTVEELSKLDCEKMHQGGRSGMTWTCQTDHSNATTVAVNMTFGKGYCYTGHTNACSVRLVRSIL